MTLFICLLIVFYPLQHVFSWKADRHPVDQIQIIRSFGETKSKDFNTTVEYAGNQMVYAIGDGEVIYQENREDNPLRSDMGRGKFVVIDHADNIRSYYLNLKESSVSAKSDKVTKATVIGESSFQSAVDKFTVQLMVEDVLQKKIVNPLNVLPAISDKKIPKVQSVFVVINDNVYSFKNSKPLLRYRGEIKLYGIAKDNIIVQGEKGGVLWPRGVKRVSFYIDDAIWRDYDFNYLLIKKDGLKLFPEHSHDEIYGIPFNFKFGIFVPTRSAHTFELVAEDFAGNRSSKKYRVSFR